MVQHNLTVHNLVHEQNTPRQFLVRWRNAEYSSQMSTAERGSRRDGVALRNLVLNGRLEIRKGGTDAWLSRDGLM
jgi:hypothetical protein